MITFEQALDAFIKLSSINSSIDVTPLVTELYATMLNEVRRPSLNDYARELEYLHERLAEMASKRVVITQQDIDFDPLKERLNAAITAASFGPVTDRPLVPRTQGENE